MNLLQTIGNLNKTTKTLIFLLITLILGLITSGIITLVENANNPYKEFKEVFDNEDIYVNFRLNETRSLSSSNEIAYYSFYTVINAKDQVEINKTIVYYTIITTSGKHIFKEDVPQNTNTITNWKPNILRKTINNTPDETPKTIYMKVIYEVIGIDQVATTKELKIKINANQELSQSVDNYVTPNQTTSGVVNNDYISMTLRTRLTSSTTRRIQLIISPKTNQEVKTIYLSGFVNISNHTTDVDDNFSNTLKYVEYSGSFLKTLATFNGDIRVDYNPTDLFFEIKLIFNDGSSEKFLYKFPVGAIPSY
jgi:hypothetical protein